MTKNAGIREIREDVDVCVIGGGMAGVCAAVAAARNGSKVVLIHDRTVFGGNASSEVRMWICGAQGLDRAPNKDLLESGIIEEIRLKNMYRNPRGNWSIWDSVTYETVRQEANISAYMNASCMDADVSENRVHSILAWQTTTQTRVRIHAKVFVDSSGDGILIPLSGADYRQGREASSEFGESIQPGKADKKTMGISCLIQTRETDQPVKFTPPDWANVYETDEDLNNRPHDLRSHNFWWLELGGDLDTIHDAENIKDELLKCAFGIWDHIKNRGDHGAENWDLEWVGFLPGKRESRRYIGDHTMTQGDVREGGRFDDLVAYGGWPMDDHHPGGMKHKGDPTQFHMAPAPYGIPYRSLYSHTVENIYCAGRNISVTHAALSSTRVMATCSVIGQAVGTAAALAAKHSLSPREVGVQKISELQQTILADGGYLPWVPREIPEPCRSAELSASSGEGVDTLRNGWGRPIGDERNGWLAAVGASATYTWKVPKKISTLRIVFDSDLNRDCFGKGFSTNMPCRYTKDFVEQQTPSSLVRAFRVEFLDTASSWQIAWQETNNYQRLARRIVDIETTAVRLVIDGTWGDESVTVFEWDVS